MSAPSTGGDGNRFLAVRHAGQEATDFSLADDAVRRFLALRDGGADRDEIARELGIEPEQVYELVRADEAYAVSHRIATGEEPMYPAPDPSQQVVDTRLGSLGIPALVLIAVLVGVILYAALR